MVVLSLDGESASNQDTDSAASSDAEALKINLKPATLRAVTTSLHVSLIPSVKWDCKHIIYKKTQLTYSHQLVVYNMLVFMMAMPALINRRKCNG